MTTFQIKMLAIVTMVIDHVGLFFFPQYLWPRLIGRIAFPLFSWMIANGALHTRDIKKYGLRLLALAVVSQIPFTLANTYIGGSPFYLNVVFTLALGLGAIYAIRESQQTALKTLAVIVAAAIANIIHADYGAAGVLSIVAFYLFFNRPVLMMLAQTVILGIAPYAFAILEALYQTSFSYLYSASSVEFYGLISLIFILLYNGELGPRTKMLFYYFYPLQYVFLYIGLLLFR